MLPASDSQSALLVLSELQPLQWRCHCSRNRCLFRNVSVKCVFPRMCWGRKWCRYGTSELVLLRQLCFAYQALLARPTLLLWNQAADCAPRARCVAMENRYRASRYSGLRNEQRWARGMQKKWASGITSARLFLCSSDCLFEPFVEPG